MRRKICIISFSNIYRDARVLRQIECLLPSYDINILGFGHCPDKYVSDVRIQFTSIPDPEINALIPKIVGKIPKYFSLIYTLFRSLFSLSAFEPWYWSRKLYKDGFCLVRSMPADLYLANDWNALPIAAEAAKENNGCLIFDAHEYAPLEFEDSLRFRLIYPRMIRYFIRKYAPMTEGFITVSPGIGERYRDEFGLNPTIILNAPDAPPVASRSDHYPQIYLVHHGGAMPGRKLEKMIETLQYCPGRFKLHFMLIEAKRGYIQKLKSLAETLVPGRVEFHDPVPPAEVPAVISQYDIGFYLLEPGNYNNRMALPNKIFDFISAGLAVCVGPTPEMARLVSKNGLGIVAPSFDPKEVAEALNRLSYEQIDAMKAASRAAALKYNAKNETQKLVRLCDEALQKKAKVCAESSAS